MDFLYCSGVASETAGFCSLRFGKVFCLPRIIVTVGSDCSELCKNYADFFNHFDKSCSK